MPITYGQSKNPIFHCYLHYNIQTFPNIHSHIPMLSSLGIKMPVPYGESQYPVFHHFLCSYFKTFSNFYIYFSLGIKMPVPNGKPEYFQSRLHFHIQTNPNIYSHVSCLSSLGVTFPVSCTISDQLILPCY